MRTKNFMPVSAVVKMFKKSRSPVEVRFFESLDDVRKGSDWIKVELNDPFIRCIGVSTLHLEDIDGAETYIIGAVMSGYGGNPDTKKDKPSDA